MSEPRASSGGPLHALRWSLSGDGSAAILRVVVTVALARLLDPSDFGHLATAMVIVSLADIAAQGGIAQALVQRLELTATQVRTAISVALVLGGGLACGLALSGPWLARLLRDDALPPLLWALSFTLVPRAVSSVVESLFVRAIEFRTVAVVRLSAYLFGYAPVAIALALRGQGVWALVAAEIARSGLEMVLLLRRRPQSLWPGFDRGACKELLFFAGGQTLGKLVNEIALKGDYFVVGRWLGAPALGLYQRAYDLLSAPVGLLGRSIDNVAFASFARLQRDTEALQEGYRRSLSAAALLVGPAAVVFVIVAPELVPVLLGDAWTEAVVPFRILAVAMPLRLGYKFGANVARASGAVYGLAGRKAVYAALVVGGSWIGQHFGLPGVCGFVVLALAVQFVTMSQIGNRITGLRWREFVGIHLFAVPPALGAGIAAGGLATLGRWLQWPSAVVLILGLGAGFGASAVALRYLPLGRDGRAVRTLLLTLIRRSKVM